MHRILQETIPDINYLFLSNMKFKIIIKYNYLSLSICFQQQFEILEQFKRQHT